MGFYPNTDQCSLIAAAEALWGDSGKGPSFLKYLTGGGSGC
jgi:hypothetical protein